MHGYFPATESSADHVVKTIESGGVVILPTDTVYGIFGNALDPNSVERAYRIKQRERRKPFVIYTTAERVREVARVNATADRLMHHFWPGALALVLRKRSIITDTFTDGKDTVAVMTAGNSLMVRVLQKASCVVFGTTCNISGEPEIKRASDLTALAQHVDIVVAGDALIKYNMPSTIVDCTTAPLSVLRESAIPASDVLRFVNSLSDDPQAP